MDTDPPSNLIYLTVNSFDFTSIIFLAISLLVITIISCAEKIYFSISNKEIAENEDNQNFKIKSIIRLLEKPKKLLLTFQITNYTFKIIVAFFCFYILDFLVGKYLNQSFLFIITLFASVIILLVFGEIIPRIYYLEKNKVESAKKLLFPIIFLEKILSPISLPLRAIIINLQESKQKKIAQFAIENNNNNTIVHEAAEHENRNEQKIIDGIISFGTTEVDQVMTPRIDIFAINIEESFEDILPKIIEKGFSRIPVFQGNIDKIVGVLFVKDLIAEISNKDFDWTTLIRKPFFVPENKKLENLLKDFQNLKNHLAIVVDEYGETSGLLTLEDVIEEIVGDINDEFDEDELNYTKIDDHNYIFEGKTNLIDFYKIISVDENSFENKSGEAETIAGLILEILESFPVKGQVIEFENCKFTIEAVEKKRIKQIKVTLQS